MSLPASSLEIEGAPDEEVLAAASIVAGKRDPSKDSATLEVAHFGDIEKKLEVKQALDALGGDDGFAGLPAYRFASGREVAAGLSPLVTDASIQRFLKQSLGDPVKAAEAIKSALLWRQLVLPPNGVNDERVLCLLNEDRRFRELGANTNGDLVFALDFCWGHFYEDEVGPLDCLRMLLLAVEKACEAADALGRPQLILIIFGGPPPCLFAQVCYKFLERYYPERLKKAVVYPVPSVWASVVSACMYFLSAEIRTKIAIVTEEAALVEAADLTGPDQLPEDWRGGIEAVDAKYEIDKSLLRSIVMQYLNPFQESPDLLEKAMQDPWREASH